jgi:KaiC/GvpD/RAD55 family RecA-like ATPase
MVADVIDVRARLVLGQMSARVVVTTMRETPHNIGGAHRRQHRVLPTHPSRSTP